MNLDRVGTESRELARDAVVPPRANCHDQVTVLHCPVGVGRPVHAEHAQVQRVILRARALTEQRVDDRCVECLCQFQNRRAGIRDHGAVAHVQHWLAALHQEAGGLAQQRAVGMGRHIVARQVYCVDKWRRAWSLGDVLRQVDQHRSRPSRGGDMKGFLHDARNIIGVLDQITVLHDWICDAGHVRFLEGVLAEH